MFVDATAIVAILAREPDADTLADALEGARAAITSPIAIVEAIRGLCPKRAYERGRRPGRRRRIPRHRRGPDRLDHQQGGRECAGCLRSVRERNQATSPAQYGRLLRLCRVRSYRTVLLFKGEDFSKIDIRSASAARA
jgi:ribonuclease VapC